MTPWLLALVACDGDDADGNNPGGGPSAPTGPGGTSPTECPGCGELPVTTRFARLTHLQWENTVQDLLHLPGPTGLSETFIGDPLAEGFENDAEGLVVSAELWLDYQRAAEALAIQVVRDPALYALVVPQDPRTGGGGVSFDQTIEAEDPLVEASTGATSGDHYNLWSAGTLVATFDVPADGDYTVSTRVWADQAGPDLAQMTLSVDGLDLLTTDVTAETSATAETFAVQSSLGAGLHTVTVAFLNDYYVPETGDDRNLRVDWMAVAGGSALGTSTATDTERDEWIRAFGLLAHRRPLADAEVTAYASLFDQGPALVDTGDDFADGVQVVLTAMLQSPHFVYRIEDGATPDASGRIPLSAFEVAAKLSYGLWNTMPDADLLAHAESGTLLGDDVLRAQIDRMLADPRAAETVADFHRQLLDLDNYVNITKDPTLYPEFGPTTAASMQAEAQAFVADVTFGGGGVHELLTAPRSFVNEDLAKIYGLPGVTGEALVPVDLDPMQRAGLLTMPGFLALEGDAYVHSPIRRGVFVNLNVLCSDLPPPPDNVPPIPPPEGVMTTRDQVEAHTGAGTCGEGCHSVIINPIGFAYERYDALGRYRTEEYGLPVNSADTFGFSTGPQSYDDAVDLAALLAEEPYVHACYAGHWLEYLAGRHLAIEDGALMDAIATTSLATDLPIRDLMIELLMSDNFRYRSPEVL